MATFLNALKVLVVMPHNYSRLARLTSMAFEPFCCGLGECYGLMRSVLVETIIDKLYDRGRALATAVGYRARKSDLHPDSLFVQWLVFSSKNIPQMRMTTVVVTTRSRILSQQPDRKEELLLRPRPS